MTKRLCIIGKKHCTYAKMADNKKVIHTHAADLSTRMGMYDGTRQ